MDIVRSLFLAEEDLRTALLRYMVANERGPGEIATELGLATNTMMSFLHGTRKTSFKTLLRLTKLLGFEVKIPR